MRNEVMNLDALAAATTLLFGREETAIVAKTYHAFAAAMGAAFEEGRRVGVLQENDRAEGLIDAAFDEGFEAGAKFAQLEAAVAEEDATQAIDESFDDGYLDGVDDARRRPAFADDRVQQIINDRADEAFEALEYLAFNDADERLHDEY